MKLSFLCILGLFLFSLEGAPRDLRLEELAFEVAEQARLAHANQTDLTLLHERLENITTTLSSLENELKKHPQSASLEAKVLTLEKNLKIVTSDLTLLKDSINATLLSFSQAEKKIDALDKTLSSDIKSLKNTLQSMLSLIEGKGSKSYTVKSGDTLEKIASHHNTSIKTLKELNSLESDKIIAGQSLQLP